MSANQGQRGRLPRSVYVKRRLWVLAGLAAVIAIIVLLIWRPGSSSGAENPDKKPAAAASATPTEQSTPTEESAKAEVAECGEDDVEVKAMTDKQTYASGELPQLSLSITNTSDSPCTMDVGTSQQVFTITSGEDTYWTSTDCQTEPTNAVTTLEPGKTLTSKPAIEWDRTSSSPDTCDSEERTAVPGEGASYHLTTKVGDVTSAETAQFVLY